MQSKIFNAFLLWGTFFLPLTFFFFYIKGQKIVKIASIFPESKSISFILNLRAKKEKKIQN